MNRLVLTAFVVALAHLPAVPAGAQDSAPGADPQEGHRLAVKICAACHVVAADQPDPPILQPPAPRFAAIAKRPAATADWLRNFIETTHTTLRTPNNMPNPQLTDDQAAAVISYILSLKPKH
jgi:mono/diheme cytochrome c family protein